jgi:hypothetical protein
MKQIWQTLASSITFSSESFPCDVQAGACGTDCVLQQKMITVGDEVTVYNKTNFSRLWGVGAGENLAIPVKLECTEFQMTQNAVSHTTVNEKDQNLHKCQLRLLTKNSTSSLTIMYLTPMAQWPLGILLTVSCRTTVIISQ